MSLASVCKAIDSHSNYNCFSRLHTLLTLEKTALAVVILSSNSRMQEVNSPTSICILSMALYDSSNSDISCRAIYSTSVCMYSASFSTSCQEQPLVLHIIMWRANDITDDSMNSQSHYSWLSEHPIIYYSWLVKESAPNIEIDPITFCDSTVET